MIFITWLVSVLLHYLSALAIRTAISQLKCSYHQTAIFLLKCLLSDNFLPSDTINKSHIFSNTMPINSASTYLSTLHQALPPLPLPI